MSHLTKYLERWKDRRVLVVGDVMLDRYTIVDKFDGTCPEAQDAPIMRVLRRETYAGGAANAAANASNLGADVTLLGAVGRDTAAAELDDILARRGVNTRLVVTGGQPTTTKSRIIGPGGRMLARLDDDQSYLDEREDRQLASELRNAIFLLAPDAILLSDYSKGVLGGLAVVECLAEFGELVAHTILDPRRGVLDGKVEIDAVTPNRRESIMIGGPGGRRFFDVIPGLQAVVETRGAWGAVIRSADSPDYLVRTVEVKRPHVCGAGDTFAAALTLARVAGADWVESTEIANAAARIAVTHPGTVAPSADTLRTVLP